MDLRNIEKKDRQLQRRRLRAGRLLLRGVPQAEVARRVEVTRTTVSAWNEQLESGGLEALKRRPRGRPGGLDAQQKSELVNRLKQERWRRVLRPSCGRCGAWPS